MKTQLMQQYSQMCKQGYYSVARFILCKLLHMGWDGDTTIYIGDGNSPVWESGFAQWLMDNCKWYNKNHGFIAELK